MKTLIIVVFCSLAAVCVSANPQKKQAFHAGEVIPEFGKIADVDSDMPLNENTKLKLCFDVATRSGRSSVNRSLDSAARFINLNVASGAAPENIEVAIVLHGSAAIDATKREFYTKDGKAKANPNAAIIAELQKNNSTLYICGQSAAGLGIKKQDLLPGVKLAPSAMTAHAILQQQGYSLCPF